MPHDRDQDIWAAHNALPVNYSKSKHLNHQGPCRDSCGHRCSIQTDLLSLCQNHLEDASLFVAQAYGKANPLYKVIKVFIKQLSWGKLFIYSAVYGQSIESKRSLYGQFVDYGQLVN